MSKVYQSCAACSPSAQDNTYVYAIIPVADRGLAAITSADELVLLNRQDLSSSPISRLANVPERVSCLVSGDGTGNVLLCSGGDGFVATFDVRSQARVSHFKIDRAVTALARKDTQIALGTEFARHQAVVSVWDQRQNRELWHNAENNDDITALDFHSLRSNVLLAGGDDGQVSIFDTNVTDEDESLLQGVNFGPIHKAAFVGNDRFFALSSDQNLSIYPISRLDDSEDPPPTALGDLRSVIPCEYVIDVFRSGDEYVVATGSNINNPRINIVELRSATDLSKEPKLEPKTGYVLEAGHGEEVVRSIFADDTTGTIFTAGEDGSVKAFKLVDSAVQSSVSIKTSAKSKRVTEDTKEIYQTRISQDFAQYADTDDVLNHETSFTMQWIVYDVYQGSDNLDIRLNAQYTPKNVRIKDGSLILTQRGYSHGDLLANRPVSIAAIQTKDSNILHGTFRATMKLSESNGGACASLFWYHNDRSEIDIEAVTNGTSLVSDTINYTNHPALDTFGDPIPNATLSLPMSEEHHTNFLDFHEHRFDCDQEGVKFYLDNRLIKTDNHSIAKDGGSLQLKLWADGNKWWSGVPSTTDVHLSVKNIIAFYNTTADHSDVWIKECNLAGGPSRYTVCNGDINSFGANGNMRPTSRATVQPAEVQSATIANAAARQSAFWLF